jgi:uncharacterized hydrophobic protein (TIGR00271 family)
MYQNFLSHALRIEEGSKPRLYRQIYDSAELGSASYLLDLVFAAGIATLGLVLNSPAVVIGAMLISPLFGPILASGLAFAASDIYLGVKALVNLLGSIIASITFSAILVWLLPFQSPTSEVLARTQPNLLDLGVAIISGLAGSVIMARSLSGGSAGALPGVAIAVALMPPLCTVGFGVGSGWNWQIISGASLLFITNLVAIAASAFLVFYLIDMDSEELRSSIPEAERRHATGTRIYRFLHENAVARVFGDVGQLRWRILMVVITIGVLFVPLRSSLMQLRDETLSRSAAREAVRALVPADHLLSQQLEIFPDHLIQRMVTTTHIDKQNVLAAEAEVARRTGKRTSIQIRQVANEEELISLRESLMVMEPAQTNPTLGSMGESVLPLVEAPLNAVWPKGSAERIDYEVGFGKDSTIVRIGYNSQRALDSATMEAIQNALRAALQQANLKVILDWRGPAKKLPVQSMKIVKQ